MEDFQLAQSSNDVIIDTPDVFCIETPQPYEDVNVYASLKNVFDIAPGHDKFNKCERFLARALASRGNTFENEINLEADTIYTVVGKSGGDVYGYWWYLECSNGTKGWAPRSCLERVEFNAASGGGEEDPLHRDLQKIGLSKDSIDNFSQHVVLMRETVITIFWAYELELPFAVSHLLVMYTIKMDGQALFEVEQMKTKTLMKAAQEDKGVKLSKLDARLRLQRNEWNFEQAFGKINLKAVFKKSSTKKIENNIEKVRAVTKPKEGLRLNQYCQKKGWKGTKLQAALEMKRNER